MLLLVFTYSCDEDPPENNNPANETTGGSDGGGTDGGGTDGGGGLWEPEIDIQSVMTIIAYGFMKTVMAVGL